jgi:hypothetical protein
MHITSVRVTERQNGIKAATLARKQLQHWPWYHPMNLEGYNTMRC